MKLAISNIAWPAEKTEYMLALIKSLGCNAIEIAASKLWSEPINSTREQRKDFLKLIKKNNLTVIALHSLLYTRRDLMIFGDEQVQLKTVEYLKRLIELGADLGVKVLVFGCPPARDCKDLKMSEAISKAAKFFYPVAKFAEKYGVCMLIEPLGKAETNFINTVSEGIKLVKMINSEGFQLHLDAKSITEELLDQKKLIKSALPYMKHFHINDPGLIEVGSIADYHYILGKILREVNYNGYVSIEMKTLNNYENAVTNSINLAKDLYIG